MALVQQVNILSGEDPHYKCLIAVLVTEVVAYCKYTLSTGCQEVAVLFMRIFT